MSARQPLRLASGLPRNSGDLARALHEREALRLQGMVNAQLAELLAGQSGFAPIDLSKKSANNSGFGAFDALPKPKELAEFLEKLSEKTDFDAVKKVSKWACGSWDNACLTIDALMDRMRNDPQQNRLDSACNQTLIRLALRYPERVIERYGKGLEHDEQGLALDERLLAETIEVDGEPVRPIDPRYDLLRVARITREGVDQTRRRHAEVGFSKTEIDDHAIKMGENKSFKTLTSHEERLAYAAKDALHAESAICAVFSQSRKGHFTPENYEIMQVAVKKIDPDDSMLHCLIESWMELYKAGGPKRLLNKSRPPTDAELAEGIEVLKRRLAHHLPGNATSSPVAETELTASLGEDFVPVSCAFGAPDPKGGGVDFKDKPKPTTTVQAANPPTNERVIQSAPGVSV